MVKLMFSAIYTQPPVGQDPVMLTVASDMTSFGYFQRGSVLEMCTFFGRQFAKAAQPGTRSSVKHEGERLASGRTSTSLGAATAAGLMLQWLESRGFLCADGAIRGHTDARFTTLRTSCLSRVPRVADFFCYVYSTPHGFNAVCFADHDYPSRVAFGYLAQVSEQFVKVHAVPTNPEENCFTAAFKGEHDALLAKFQDPASADQLTSIMRQLDETKLVLHETIEAAIDRGQKLDTLVEKSNELSGSSKMFYKTARKQNQCCKLM
mmetsp:Transcript_21345/g.52643  ORF Transcript_21345/g.52643 Transcript_21345/m.52643 type:complete len:264 (+) Transcript_21345:103-894(+)